MMKMKTRIFWYHLMNGEVSEDTDVEEAFINGEHRFIVDPENDYEKQRLINIKVEERLSQLGLSPRTLKNKHRALARDFENKVISKCAAKHILERPPTTNRATSSWCMYKQPCWRCWW